MQITTKYDIDWVKCVAVYADGANAMTGRRSILIVRLQQVMRGYIVFYIDKLLSQSCHPRSILFCSLVILLRSPGALSHFRCNYFL